MNMASTSIQKLILLLLLCAVSQDSMAASQIDCLKVVEVKVTKLYPRIRIDDEGNRLDRVGISLPVRCANQKYLIPSTLDDAMRFLDKVIPLDIKIAMVRSGDSSIYGNSRYGYSVVSDIIDKLYEVWRIIDSSGMCREVQLRLRRNDDDASCGQSLVDQFILLYKEDMEGKAVSNK